jgi:hypothetical protein
MNIEEYEIEDSNALKEYYENLPESQKIQIQIRDLQKELREVLQFLDHLKTGIGVSQALQIVTGCYKRKMDATKVGDVESLQKKLRALREILNACSSAVENIDNFQKLLPKEMSL